MAFTRMQYRVMNELAERPSTAEEVAGRLGFSRSSSQIATPHVKAALDSLVGRALVVRTRGVYALTFEGFRRLNLSDIQRGDRT